MPLLRDAALIRVPSLPKRTPKPSLRCRETRNSVAPFPAAGFRPLTFTLGNHGGSEGTAASGECSGAGRHAGSEPGRSAGIRDSAAASNPKSTATKKASLSNVAPKNGTAAAKHAVSPAGVRG